MNEKYRNTFRISIENYLNEVEQIPLLTEDEERDLGKRVAEGDNEAINILIQSNLRFVISIAKEYQNRGLPLEDLINEGNMGLIKAASKFDVSKNARFITYAVWWIRQSIMDAIIKHGSSIRLPYNKAWDYMKLQKVKATMKIELGREPDEKELSKQVGFDAANFSDIGSNFGKDVSLDDLLFDEEEKSVKDILPDLESLSPDDQLLDASMSKDIELVLNTLPEREKQIVSLYFGIHGGEALNLTEIGEELSLSRERVRQLKEIALEKIRSTNRGTVLRQYLG